MTEASILLIDGLKKRFGGVVAIDDVTLDVAAGDLRCIIGPNGAGKSTFFALLCGIHRLDDGRIVFKGKDITRMLPSRRVREGLGLTFQTNRVFGNLSVRQNLEIPLASIRSDTGAEGEDRYRMALERFGLDRDDETPAAKIPHHKRQWLEIAMVMAGNPDIMLLDEPTAGMAPEETGNTAAVLRDLNRAGLTILVVEHDMAFVRQIARRVTVLHQGRVFAEGTIDEVTARQDVRDIYLGRR
ncbi:MAG TPA: ABC transporter ATP-binding protein [Roseiarcus sp.]|jgi:branched-chain amino acid transport system ATP-binding protein|nr:ABC transporter ATP-binding protein [Roseiarcus sp.]